MKVLAIDNSAEGQALIANRLENFDPVDLETLDLTINLCSPHTFQSRIPETDVLITGPSVAGEIKDISRQARAINPNISIIQFIPNCDYSKASLRSGQAAGVNKILREDSSTLDLFQELLRVHDGYRTSGKIRNGSLVSIAQAKGGVGATTICAGLGELCERKNKKTMLWDLDLESRDLSRSLMADGPERSLLSSWVEDPSLLNGKELKRALYTVGDYLSLLMTPGSTAASLDFLGHTEGIEIAGHVIELARVTHDNIIVDTAGRLCPTSGYLMRESDYIVIVVDDSILGLTAAHAFLETMMPIVKNRNSIRFLCSGLNVPKIEIQRFIERELDFSEDHWILPELPADPAGGKWPATGKTLYSMGSRATKKAFESIAGTLGLLEERRAETYLEHPGAKTIMQNSYADGISYDTYENGNLAQRK